MAKEITRHVPNRQQRALRQAQDKAALAAAVDRLTDAELLRVAELLAEAGWPKSLTDHAAILDRARAFVEGQAGAEKEAQKTPEQHRKELWG